MAKKEKFKICWQHEGVSATGYVYGERIRIPGVPFNLFVHVAVDYDEESGRMISLKDRWRVSEETTGYACCLIKGSRTDAIISTKRNIFRNGIDICKKMIEEKLQCEKNISRGTQRRT